MKHRQYIQPYRERLKIVRQTLKVNQRIFAKGIFISTSFYACLETGHRQITEKILDLISKIYGVNKNWILTGQGEMFNNDPPDVKLEELIDTFKRLNKHFQGYILDHIRNLERIQDNELKNVEETEKEPKNRARHKESPVKTIEAYIKARD